MDMLKIIRLAAIAVSVVAAFVVIPYVAIVLIVLGLAVGFMGVSEERRIVYMVTTITLATGAGSLGAIPMVGEYLTAMLTNLSSVLNAGAVAVIVMIIKDRLTE